MEKFSTFNPKNILCPIDFSQLSDLALKYAAKGAFECKAALTVVHAETFEVPPYLFRSQGEKYDREISAAGETLERELAAHVKGILRDLAGSLDLRFRVLDRQPADAILDAAEETPADLIVLGTHGYGGLKRFVLGSVAQRVVENAMAPVFLVRQKESDFIDVTRPEAVPRLKKILCPCSLTEVAETTLKYAVSIARRFQARLTVLHVCEGTARDDQSIREKLQGLMQRNADKDLSMDLAVGRGVPAEVIIGEAWERGADLIILAAHHHPIGKATYYGRTTDLVVRHASVPVLVRPHVQ